MADARRTPLDAGAIVLVVGCCFLWGLNQVAAKAALPEIAPLWQAAARSVGGTVLVGAWAASRGVTLGGRDGTARAGLLAGLLFSAEFACIFFGLQHTTASRMAVFLYISPFVVALGMPFVSKAERLAPAQALGLLLAFSGVFWAFSEGFTRPAGAAHAWRGDALGLVAGVIWGATTLTIRATPLATAPPEKTLLWQLAVSAVVLTLLAFVQGAPWPARLSAPAGLSLAFQVVVVTSISFQVWFWLVRRYPATQLSSFTLLTPVFGLVLGGWLLDEPITGRLVVGVLAIGAGLVLVNRRPHRGTLGRARRPEAG